MSPGTLVTFRVTVVLAPVSIPTTIIEVARAELLPNNVRPDRVRPVNVFPTNVSD